MAGIKLFTSNRMEILARALAEVLRTPLSSPLEKEIILVQSRGMERWISMELARYHGVAANYAFPFPNAFVRDMFRRIAPETPERSPFDPDILTWRIMKRLPDLIHRPGFEGLGTYLGQKGAILKRLQLSGRIADLFDQYLLFRPEMVGRWEQGHGTHWQAVLWRELVHGHEGRHRAALARIFHGTMGTSKLGPEDFPERVAVFGISALPVFHMKVLSTLSRFSEVNLFLMNPCREYWGDILSGWEIKRTGAAKKVPPEQAPELHMEKGNSLLSSMGALGRDFLDLVQELEGEEFSSFVDPGEETLLSCIQSDILNLRERAAEGKGKRILSENDHSLQIHSCHSPMREMEALQDRLLDLFDRQKGLAAGDILVMTPDIEAYAPYIQAVFDIPKDDPRWIPFSIADRSIRHESGIIETFMSILGLQGGRYGASRVLGILESPAVQRRFGLQETDLDIIRQWVRDAGIRWGISEKTRADLGLPGFRENTWEAGLDRLLLGYALPGKEERVFGGVLPYDLIEGEQALVLGAFLDFASRLFEKVQALETPREPMAWTETLMGILDAFFTGDDESEREFQAVRKVVNDLADIFVSGGLEFREALDLPLIKWYLDKSFERQGFGVGFLSGGVTFCAMLPMRSIPFRVIGLVGMNGDSYPRQSRPLGFDLMARRPRPGDRSRRNDDRYIFLEGLVSARETLYISYVGQDIQDNTPLPPSVLVSEVLDYAEEGFDMADGNLLDHIVIRHRIQAFSPDYFRTGGRLFSYSRENCEAARRLSAPSRNPTPFISEGLQAPAEDAWKEVGLGDLARFYANPAKELLTRRLGIRLEERSWAVEEREAFVLKGLDRYALENHLFEKRLGGQRLAELWPAVRASGRLPHGSVGKVLFETMAREIEAFTGKLDSLRIMKGPEPLEVDLSLSGFRITGRIGPFYGEGLLQYRYTRLKVRDLLRLWLDHLVLNIAGEGMYPRTSVLAGLNPEKRKDSDWIIWTLAPVEGSEGILSFLLKTYWEGLMRPVRFFPESAWAFAREVLEKKKEPQEAYGKARKVWEGGEYSRGEMEDPYYQRCFGEVDPLDGDFEHLALAVFKPILKHWNKVN